MESHFLPITKLEEFPKVKSLKFFIKKGVKCVKCGCEGKYIGKNKQKVWAIYTEDYVQLTRDHIVPISKGGTNKLENLQTMCEYCNRLKSHIDNTVFMNIPNQFLDGKFVHSRSFKTFIFLLKVFVNLYKRHQKMIRHLHSHSLFLKH
jgi:hypothetical protein